MPAFRRGKKRRMTKFLLSEVSSVDAPASAGARALLLKRTDGSSEDGGTADLLNKKEATMPTEDKAVDTAVQDLTKRLERAEAVVGLTAAERTHFDTLDKDAQDVFLGKSKEDRAADIAAAAEIVAKAGEAKDVVYRSDNGQVFTKADDVRLVAMAKQRDEDRRELAKLRASEAQVGFEKRATDLLPNLPGTVEVRAAIVKALDTITDEATRKAAFESVVAGSKAMTAAFDKLGRAAGDKDSELEKAEDELNRLAKERAAAKSIDFYTAYDEVALENPKLAKAAVGSTVPTSN